MFDYKLYYYSNRDKKKEQDILSTKHYLTYRRKTYDSGKKTKQNKQTNKENKGVLVCGSSSRFLRKLRPWQKQRKRGGLSFRILVYVFAKTKTLAKTIKMTGS